MGGSLEVLTNLDQGLKKESVWSERIQLSCASKFCHTTGGRVVLILVLNHPHGWGLLIRSDGSTTESTMMTGLSPGQDAEGRQLQNGQTSSHGLDRSARKSVVAGDCHLLVHWNRSNRFWNVLENLFATDFDSETVQTITTSCTIFLNLAARL